MFRTRRGAEAAQQGRRNLPQSFRWTFNLYMFMCEDWSWVKVKFLIFFRVGIHFKNLCSAPVAHSYFYANWITRYLFSSFILMKGEMSNTYYCLLTYVRILNYIMFHSVLMEKQPLDIPFIGPNLDLTDSPIQPNQISGLTSNSFSCLLLSLLATGLLPSWILHFLAVGHRNLPFSLFVPKRVILC